MRLFCAAVRPASFPGCASNSAYIQSEGIILSTEKLGKKLFSPKFVSLHWCCDTDDYPYSSRSGGFNSDTLQLAGEAAKACCGETLTEEDLLKVSLSY